MTDDMSVFDLVAEGGARKDPLATALAQAAAHQVRAERLEGALERLAIPVRMGIAGVCKRCGTSDDTDHQTFCYARIAREAISSPRPSPSRILEVARAAVRNRQARDRIPGAIGRHEHGTALSLRRQSVEALDEAIGNLTPEERAAILGEGE